MQKLDHSSLPKRLANSIQAQIINAGMCEGEKLPTEPELMKSFGVSRTVVREAAALLISRGLVGVVLRKVWSRSFR